jgi:hypothetical protein
MCAVIDYENGPIAQRLEQGTHNPLVPGSNPGGPIQFRISDGRFRKGRREIEDQIADVQGSFLRAIFALTLPPLITIAALQGSRPISRASASNGACKVFRVQISGEKDDSLGNPLTEPSSITIVRRAEEIHPTKAHVVDRRRIVKRGH